MPQCMLRMLPAVLAGILCLAPASGAQSLLTSVLPSSRSVRVGVPATAFATGINTGQATATGCRLAPFTDVVATFVFQTTDATTNQTTGMPDTPVDIPPGQARTFVFAFTPTGPVAATEIPLGLFCARTAPSAVVAGLNTLLLSAAESPVPDIVALAATRHNDGIVQLTGTGVFAVATANVGAGDRLTVTADTGAVSLPVALTLCQTHPDTGACLSPPGSSVRLQIDAGATPTFGIFIEANGSVAFDPAVNRIFVRFQDSTGVTRGATSVAVRTLVASPRASSAAAMTADGATVFVVNPETHMVSVVDTRTDTRVGEVAVGPVPQTLALSSDDRRLYVTSQDNRTLTVLDTGPLAVLATIPVGAEPYGVVAAPQGTLVYVASAATASVEVVDVSRQQVVARLPVGPKPRGLALSAAGSRLYVTHFLSGEVSVIDLERHVLLQVIGTGSESNMAQKLVLHPTNGRAYLPHIRSNVSNRNLLFDTTIFPVVSVLELATNQHLPRERLELSVIDRPVNLPFDLTLSPDGQRFYVTHLGSGDVSVVDLNTRRLVAHVDVGDGPRGLVLTPDGRKAYVLNSLSDDVSVLDTTTHQEVRRIPLSASALPPEIRRGRLLFFSSRALETSRERWMSCASCHFEGDHDGRTWFFPPRGPRNTTSLRGIGQTRPLHWSADRDEIQDFEFTIRELQAGTGLIHDAMPHPALGVSNAGRSADLEALTAFIESLQPKPSPFRSGDAALTSAIQRGQEIFARSEVGCALCHVPPHFTDSTSTAMPFIVHDVGTGGGADEGFGPAFDTPALLGLWDSAPYLHDGSASTLRDVLITGNAQNLHGRTSHLSEAELFDLIAFLLSL